MYVSDKDKKNKDKVDKVKRKIFTTASEESMSPTKKKVKIVVDIPNEGTTDVENKNEQNVDLSKVKKENNEIKLPSDSTDMNNLPLIENGNVT